MEPGRSAQQVAQRETVVARSAAAKAAAFAKGASGERAVAEALAPLSSRGWVVLHDRRAPGGGNVDHVAIGDTGVYVLDAKAWSGGLTVHHGRLHAGNRDCHADIERTARIVEGLSAAGIPHVAGYLVFVGTDLSHAPNGVAGVGLVSADDVTTTLVERPAVLTAGEHDRLVARVLELLPSIDAAPVLERPEAVPPMGLDTESAPAIAKKPAEDRYRFYVAREWRGGAKRRTYLTAAGGNRLGWIDHHDGGLGDIHAPDAAALLRRLRNPAALPTPDVTCLLPVGRMIAAGMRAVGSDDVGNGHVVGVVWRRAELRRLYLQLHVTGHPCRQIGWIDLLTGQQHVTSASHRGLVQHAWHVLFDDLAPRP